MHLHDLYSQLRADPRSVQPSTLGLGTTLFGVEIELENAAGLRGGTYWAIKNDDSLRNNGRELVFAVPLGGRDVDLALDEYSRIVQECTPPPALSMRTGLHVHVDVRALTLEQVAAVIVAYAALESAMYSICGSKDRYDNIYCPGLTSNDQAKHLRKLVKAIGDGSTAHIHDLISSAEKYSGVNVRPMSSQGSIEFRMYRATLNSGDILEVLQCLCKIIEYAKERSVSEIVQDMLTLQDSYCSEVLRTDKYDSVYKEYYNNNIYNSIYISNTNTHDPELSSGNTQSIPASIAALPEEVQALLFEIRERYRANQSSQSEIQF